MLVQDAESGSWLLKLCGSVYLWISSTAVIGVLEIQTLRPHPRLNEPKPEFKQYPQVTCVHIKVLQAINRMN